MRFRVPINRAFLPARMKAMEDEIRVLAKDFLDNFVGDGKVEIIGQFADPLRAGNHSSVVRHSSDTAGSVQDLVR